MHDPKDLVTVTAFRDSWNAHIACGRLRAEDVPAFVIDDNIVQMNWMLSQAVGGVKLWVPTHALHEASRIIGLLKAGEYDGLLEDYEPVYATGPCPACGSSDLKKVFSIDRLLLLFGFLLVLGIIFPIYRDQRLCKNCDRYS